jgi:hypothetical protein
MEPRVPTLWRVKAVKRARPIARPDVAPPASGVSFARARRLGLAAILPAVLAAFALGAWLGLAAADPAGQAPDPAALEAVSDGEPLADVSPVEPYELAAEPTEAPAVEPAQPEAEPEDALAGAPDPVPANEEPRARRAAAPVALPRPSASSHSARVAVSKEARRVEPETPRARQPGRAATSAYRPEPVASRPRRVSPPASRIIGPIVIGGCSDRLGRPASSRPPVKPGKKRPP